jgi:pyrophosphate--fructose-6-phosphate 1-phosphotransferase
MTRESVPRESVSKGVSALEKARLGYVPQIPEILRRGIRGLAVAEVPPAAGSRDDETIRGHFPRTHGRPGLRFVEGSGPREVKPLVVGVVLSGGQAPGGHNVITGLFDGLKAFHGESRLFGFLGGPKGIMTAKYEELTKERVDAYRNTGGFDMIRSGRDKIETAEDLERCCETAGKLALGGLVVIGGDDSNTNAAVVSEHFLSKGLDVSVVGVPKTIDGDLKSDEVEASFGFDTATKVYSELIGNICRDAKSAAKYWHFVKLMGRSASHVTLECALQTQPNIAIIGEEVEEKKMTIRQIVDGIAEVIRTRSNAGKNYGVCLVPEGLIEFIPEMRSLISELNVILHENEEYFKSLQTFLDRQEFINKKLSKDSSYVFSYLPARIQMQLLIDRDSHGNVQVSRIDTEQLLLEQVKEQLGEWKSKGEFKGKFEAQHHFLGYEGRCAPPSNFDADYTYALGQTAAALVAFRKTGYMSSVRNLTAPRPQWRSGGVALTSMMQIEMRKGKPKPVIAKALVRTEGAPFKRYEAIRDSMTVEDAYLYPGPIQYFGPEEVCGALTKTLVLERG